MTFCPRRALHAGVALFPLVALVAGDRMNRRSEVAWAANAGAPINVDSLSYRRLRVQIPGPGRFGLLHSNGGLDMGLVPITPASSGEGKEQEVRPRQRKVSFGYEDEVHEISSIAEARLVTAVADRIFDCEGRKVTFDFDLDAGWATVGAKGEALRTYKVEYVAHDGTLRDEATRKKLRIERHRFNGNRGFDLRDERGVAQHSFFLDEHSFYLLSQDGHGDVGALDLRECTYDVHAEVTALLSLLTGREYECTRSGASGSMLETVTFSKDRHISIVKHHGETVRFTYETAAQNYDPEHHGFLLGYRRFQSPDLRRLDYGTLAFTAPDPKGRPVLLEASCSARGR